MGGLDGSVQPPRCAHCHTILEPPGYLCAHCGARQRQPHDVPNVGEAPGRFVTTPRSWLIAAGLSVVWPGAGHLYVGRSRLGWTLTVVTGVYVLIAAIPVLGLVVPLLLWPVTALVAAISAIGDARRHNRRAGHTRTTPRGRGAR